ncbi:MAG: DUF2341 domain-containing protein [Parcubacteria group bacterium]
MRRKTKQGFKKLLKPTFSVWMVLFLILQVFAGVFAPVSDFWKPSFQKAEAATAITTFTYKKSITFNTTATGAAVSTNQGGGTITTGFPVAVHINSSSFPTAADRTHFFNDTYNPGGKRVQFFDSNETTNLNYEVEYYSTAGQEAVYWVGVPQIDGNSATDKIVVAYGNDPNGADQDNKNSVWDSNYKGVWHLPEVVTDEGSGGVHYDSTSNVNNGLQYNNNEVSGVVFNGQEFDGTGDYIGVNGSASLPYDWNGFTFTTWIKPVAGTISYMLTQYYNSNNFIKVNWDNANSRLYFRIYSYSNVITREWVSPNNSMSAGNWYNIAVTHTQDATPVLYINGVAQTVTLLGGSGSYHRYNITSSQQTRFGADIYGSPPTGFGKGTMDEHRLSALIRSADWLKLEYYSMKKTNYNGDNGASSPFITYGAEQSTAPNTAPDAPSSLAQYKSDCSTSISTGGWTSETSVCLKGYINDTDASDQVKMATEVTTGSFSGTPNFTASSYVADPDTSSVSVTGLANGSQYKWQGRSLDDDAATSGFTQFNGGAASFGIDTSAPTGSSITYTDGYRTITSVSLTAEDGTDTASGINTGSRIVQRKSATLTSGICGSYGSFATITPTGTYPNFTDSTVATGNCYQYQYFVSDNVANQATYTSTSTAKIDTAALNPSATLKGFFRFLGNVTFK